MMRPPLLLQETFRSNLLPLERDAIHWWLGLFSYVPRTYFLASAHERINFDLKHRALVMALESAVAKAIPFEGTAYRGLSGRASCTNSMDYLRDLVEGSGVVPFDAPASATVDKALGRSFMFEEEPDNEQPILSVLLVLHCLNGRWLAPFEHKAGDEFEIVIPRGSRFERKSVSHLRLDEKPDLEAWEIELVEIGEPHC
jgi:hypothetical protein